MITLAHIKIPIAKLPQGPDLGREYVATSRCAYPVELFRIEPNTDNAIIVDAGLDCLPEDLSAVASLVSNALKDPKGSVIVTGPEVTLRRMPPRHIPITLVEDQE